LKSAGRLPLESNYELGRLPMKLGEEPPEEQRYQAAFCALRALAQILVVPSSAIES
jgi:hypothetical protein